METTVGEIARSLGVWKGGRVEAEDKRREVQFMTGNGKGKCM